MTVTQTKTSIQKHLQVSWKETVGCLDIIQCARQKIKYSLSPHLQLFLVRSVTEIPRVTRKGSSWQSLREKSSILVALVSVTKLTPTHSTEGEWE